jgi:hypothetical protein
VTRGRPQFADASLDLKRIAREADVDVALAGTLRTGSKLRVNAQLVEAPMKWREDAAYIAASADPSREMTYTGWN